MTDFKCPICKQDYNKESRKCFILTCGDSACLPCIKFFKDANKDSFECGKCCNNTKSANIENKSMYNNKNIQNNKPAPKPEKDEFEIYVRKKNTQEKFSLLVKKNMKLIELINKIESQEGIKNDTYDLCFKKPLTENNKTLESYGIIKTVTITMITKFDGGI
jgi:hypothetical protein